MPILLDLVYAALLLFCSPLLLYRSVRTGKYRSGWAEKFRGKAPLRIGDRPCVWFHAVSVGEVLLLRPVVEELARRRPGWDVVISTTTSTGLAVARRTYPDLVTFYAPLDFSWATRRAVSRVRPTVLALVELELWPNLVRAAKNAGARVAIVNGRLSQRSHRGYRKLRGPLGPTLRRLDAVAAQNRGLRRAVRRPGRSARAGERDRLGEVRRAGERPLEPPHPRPAESARPLDLGAGLRGREHDGRRGGGRPGGLPVGAGPFIPASDWSSSRGTPTASTRSPTGSNARARPSCDAAVRRRRPDQGIRPRSFWSTRSASSRRSGAWPTWRSSAAASRRAGAART